MAFYLTGLAFNVSPKIERAIVSGYTQRLSKKTGIIQDDYVYSVVFDRKRFAELNFQDIDPVETITNFDNQFKITATYELKTIEPFTATG
jgi:hypothetical protein